MSDLLTIQPSQHLLVMDLVREAGVDVSDWPNYADGGRGPAANPRYCYEWAFVQPGQVVVLNVWHQDIAESGGALVLRDNLRSAATHHARGRAAASASWRRRAERFDAAVRAAFRERLPVRLVVCDGRKGEVGEERASRVRTRLLDPVSWSVTAYDSATGDFELTRGAQAARLVDQFSAGEPDDGPTETRSITGTVFLRSAEVRRVALLRAAGRCEWCGHLGFETASGGIFLETHHIEPLGEGGPDTVENVAALCPNHHREAHYGAARESMRSRLLGRVRQAIAGAPVA